ncbi:MAG: recombinase family protein [Tannerellaceae bacterium]|nr:recombinase family protein [Tannerellaceae bacterium]
MIALYIRLSLADEDISSEKEESNSIVNQRELLYDVVKEHPEFAGDEVEEFVDDGYSGMNFERPAFQRMLSLIRQRTVSVVIVKDFSRFGRDYVEVGDYMERVFPFLGVRFIAVTDGYDSVSHKIGDDKDLEIIIKNIVNSYYSRDLSEKIRTTVRAKRRRGEYVYSSRAFGYLEDPENPAQIMIDPEAGKYVRTIFELALDGRDTRMIAQKLNDQEVPTPNTYNETHRIKGKWGRQTKGEHIFWDSQKVVRILSDPVYAGAYVSAKHERVVAGKKKMRHVTPDEQIWIYDHHEAIVTMDEFEKAQEVFHIKAHNSVLPYKRHPLKGKIVCGNCNYTILYNERKVIDCFYICPCIYKTNEDFGCSRERIQEWMINDIVFRQMKLWFLVLHQIDVKLREEETKRFEQMQEVAKEVSRVQKNLKSLQNQKVSLYEDYSEGKIARETFISKRDVLAAKIEKVKEQVNELHRQENEIRNGKRKRKGDFEELIQRIDIFQNEIILTRTMTEAFLDKVIVYDKFHVEIRWAWQDLIADMGLLDEANEELQAEKEKEMKARETATETATESEGTGEGKAKENG